MCPDQYRFFQTIQEAMKSSSAPVSGFFSQDSLSALPPKITNLLSNLTVNPLPVLTAQ
jgi:hypothetical protein